MNILSLYIFDVVARLLCLRNAKRMWAPSQNNRLREIRNLLLLKQRSADKNRSGSMFAEPFVRRAMLWKSSGACVGLPSSRTNMLCSTGNSKCVCSSKSVCSYMNARKRTEMTSRFLVLELEGGNAGLLFSARYALFNPATFWLWNKNCWVLYLTLLTRSKTGLFNLKISQNAFGWW